MPHESNIILTARATRRPAGHQATVGGRKILLQNQSRPSRAALASWVELLNSQAGGGHYYEDVDGIVKRFASRAQ